MSKRWWDGKGSYFVITKTKIIDNNTWVFYTNEKTRQEYSCLQEAFLKYFIGQP